MANIEKRNDSYRITVSVGYDLSGKQIKKRMTWTPPEGMTERQIKKEVQRQAVLFEEQVQSGNVVSGAVKLQEFIEQWFTDYAAEHLRNLTIQRYRQLTKRIYPALGHIRIDRINPHNLISFYQSLGAEESEIKSGRTAKANFKAVLKSQNMTYQKLSDISGVSLRTVKAAGTGNNISANSSKSIAAALGVSETEIFSFKKEDTRKLAERTIKYYHTFLSSVFERAVKWGLIDSNPCRRVDAPKATRKETDCLTLEQAALFLEKLTDEPIELQAMFNTLLLTGMRRGELMGLEWSDIDFENLTVTIRRTSQYTPQKGIYTDTTKTEQSKRIISIPENLAELLKRYRLELMRRRFALGDKWIDSDRLFIQWDGSPMHPNTPYSYLQKLLDKFSLPKVSLHSLRHTNASVMIASGTDIRTVSGRLGHSQASTTVNIKYPHKFKVTVKAA